MQRKIQNRFVYTGLGFPVILRQVPMGKIRGRWTPLVDYNKLQHGILLVLASHPARLTGNEIHFVRVYFQMTLAEFGDRFCVSHPAVMKWESAGDEPTAMQWGIEKDIRLFILDRLCRSPRAILKLYRDLQKEASRHTLPLEMNLAA